MKHEPDDAWLTKKEALAKLSVSERSLDRLVTAGKVEKRTRPAPGRTPEPIFNRADIERITAVDAHPMPAGGQELVRSQLPVLPSPMMLAQLAEFATATRLLAAPPPPAAWLDLEAAATHSGLSAKLLRRMIAGGELAALRDGRAWKVHRFDLDELRAKSAKAAPMARGGRK